MKKLYVVCGPSGAGLSDILAELFRRRDDLTAVVPVTARKMKEGEKNGLNFWFYDLEDWNALKDSGDLIETTEFAGNDYGTSRRLVEEKLREGKNVLLSLDADRAAQIRQNMPEAVCVWAEPADEEQLRVIYARTARSALELDVRMRTAAEQRECAGFCDVRILASSPEEALQRLQELIDHAED